MMHRAYVETITTSFELGVRDVVSGLREPVAEDPQAALRLIGLVVETIAGFAVGCVCGELERAARVWFGAEAAAVVRAGVPMPRCRPLTDRAPFLVDADERPLVDEFGMQLRGRLRLVLAELERFAAYVGTVLPRGREGEIAAMFARLGELTLLGERLCHELAIAWSCASAAIEGRPLDACGDSPRSRALWRAWSKLAGISREPAQAYIAAVG
jgi:hypothetical protein